MFEEMDCVNYPCISTCGWRSTAIQLGMCEDCQSKYRQVDFNGVYKVTQDKDIPEIREAKEKLKADEEARKWVEEYSQEVKAALKK